MKSQYQRQLERLLSEGCYQTLGHSDRGRSLLEKYLSLLSDASATDAQWLSLLAGVKQLLAALRKDVRPILRGRPFKFPFRELAWYLEESRRRGRKARGIRRRTTPQERVKQWELLQPSFARTTASYYLEVSNLSKKDSIPLGSGLIKYVVGGLKDEFKPCQHHGLRVGSAQDTFNSVQRPEFTLRADGWQGTYGSWHSLSATVSASPEAVRYNPLTSSFTTEYKPSDDELVKARYDAYLRMLAGTPKDVPNFARAMFELKDLNKSIAGLADFYSFGSQLVKRGASLKLTVRQIAALYLNYSFGIKPTANDVSTFLDRLRKGMAVAPARERSKPPTVGETIVSRYRVKAPQPSMGRSAYTYTRDLSFYGGRNPPYVYTYSAPIEPYTSAAYNTRFGCRRTSYAGAIFARISSVTGYGYSHYGADPSFVWPPITTAWDLLPWSWLVDWFIDVRSYVQRAERAATTWWARCMFDEVWISERKSTDYLLRPVTWTGYEDPKRRKQSWVYGSPYVTFYVTSTVVFDEPTLRAYSVFDYHREKYIPPELSEVNNLAVDGKVNLFRLSIGASLILTRLR